MVSTEGYTPSMLKIIAGKVKGDNSTTEKEKFNQPDNSIQVQENLRRALKESIKKKAEELKENRKVEILQESHKYLVQNMNATVNNISYLSANQIESNILLRQYASNMTEKHKVMKNAETQMSYCKTKSRSLADKLK